MNAPAGHARAGFRSLTQGRLVLSAFALAAAATLSGCSVLPTWMGGDPAKPQPAALVPNPNLVGVSQAWTARVGKVEFPLAVAVNGSQVTVASSDGTVTALDADTGATVWRASAGGAVMAGAGSDGKTAAVVTRDSQLVALSAGQVLWRAPLGAEAYTPPLVAGGRVFVLAGDRSVMAFDGATGRRLWTQQRPGEALALRQAGVILAVGDTLVAGQGGRLAGLNPLTGAIRWEGTVATSRGTNDVERLVDLVGPASRVGDSVCVRAFNATVGCVDAARGATAWTRPANGTEGLGGDDRQVFGTEADGKVVAWARANGQPAWTSELLLRRGPTAPLLLGRSVAIGDNTGLVHLLSRENGQLSNRLSTDGSPIVAAPVRAGNTLVVVTRNGGVYGFVPQ